ncbi:LysE family translocator [Marinicella litoralis]|uniref:LysE family translocator n=1 Tax=Marinicella litoralis TaxID=644220 RepID=UPI000BFF14CD|nr:LysE family translocator [Marinicella litoralis]
MPEAITSLITATALLLGSPGPATLGLAGIGATSGFKNGLPFLTGILTGLIVVILGTALGLASLFEAFPSVRITVQIIGALYILYVAVKIATAPHQSTAASSAPPRFIDGFILNLLNPKAYAALLGLFSQFLLPTPSVPMAFLSTAVICFTVAVVVDTLWLALGGAIRPCLQQPVQARMIRVVFAVLMVVAVLWAFVQ